MLELRLDEIPPPIFQVIEPIELPVVACKSYGISAFESCRRFGDDNLGVTIVAPVHGWLYVIYLIAVGDLARRVEWRVTRILLVALAGTIPFLSFVMERRVVSWVRLPQEQPEPTAA